MPDQKLENLLNLAMNALPQERAKSENLNVGYDPTTRLWDVIVTQSLVVVGSNAIPVPGAVGVALVAKE